MLLALCGAFFWKAWSVVFRVLWSYSGSGNQQILYYVFLMLFHTLHIMSPVTGDRLLLELVMVPGSPTNTTKVTPISPGETLPTKSPYNYQWYTILAKLSAVALSPDKPADCLTHSLFLSTTPINIFTVVAESLKFALSLKTQWKRWKKEYL